MIFLYFCFFGLVKGKIYKELCKEDWCNRANLINQYLIYVYII